MAGLPYKVSSLLRNDSVSFLRRAQAHRLGKIADYEIAATLEKTARKVGRSISKDALSQAAKAINGFPYIMRLSVIAPGMPGMHGRYLRPMWNTASS